SWDALHIWPAFPADEYLFWQYVANAAQERGKQVPEFMQPVTDLSGVQQELVRWRRAREIEEWKQKLGALTGSPPSQGAPGAECDLRLVIAEKAAELEFKPAGQEEFRAPKSFHLNQIASGRMSLTTEAELLFNLFWK